MPKTSDVFSGKGMISATSPFRAAVWRGLALIMPPLLTIVAFIWVLNTIDRYVLAYVETIATNVIVNTQWDVYDESPEGAARHLDGHRQTFILDGETYVQLDTGKWIPAFVYEGSKGNSKKFNLKTSTAKEVYDQYVRNTYLQRYKTIPVFLLLFIMLLYLMGKFLAAGLGRVLFGLFERLIHALPIIRTVYFAAKQVTDFIFKEQQVEFTRVVAVEYPRKGVWSMGFVTGEGFGDIRNAANEPVVSVLVPTSPFPGNGFTITLPKSETIDLDVSIDEAIQFCVSCGVGIPPRQQWNNGELANQASQSVSDNGDAEPEESAAVPVTTSEGR